MPETRGGDFSGIELSLEPCFVEMNRSDPMNVPSHGVPSPQTIPNTNIGLYSL